MSQEIIVGDEVNYDPLPCKYGRYKHLQVVPQEALGSIPIQQGQTMSFQLVGDQHFNLAKSFLEGTITSSAAVGVNNYAYMHGACIPMFRQVSVNPTTGVQQIIDQYHHYSRMSLPYLVSEEKLKSYDRSSLFYASRVLQTMNKHVNPSAENANVPYDEMAYFTQLNDTANQTIRYNVKIPLELFAGTLLALDKDLKCGMPVVIQFVFEDPSNFIWLGTDQFNPITGIVNSNAVTWTFVNPILQLAVEQENFIKAELDAKYMAGYSLPVPSIAKAYQQSLTGATQNTQLPPIGATYGSHIQRIFYSLFNALPTTNASYYLDNDNCPLNTDAATNNFVQLFQTLWDGEPRQQLQIRASPQFYTQTTTENGSNADWARQYEFLKGSCYINSGVLGHSWTFVDDWTMSQGRLEKDIKDEEANKIDGIEVGPYTHSWQFQATMKAANNDRIHYAYIQGIKKLTIGPGVFNIV